MAQAQRQAISRQATAERQEMTHAAALGLISTPILMSGTKITSISIVAHLLEGTGNKDTGNYLVVQVPKKVLEELSAHIQTLPSYQREKFLEDWVAKNRDNMIVNYLVAARRSPSFKRSKKFNFELLPPVAPKQAKPKVTVPVPRRTEPKPKPAEPKPQPKRTLPKPPVVKPPRIKLPPRTTPEPQPAVTRPKVETQAPLKPVLLKGGRGTEDNPYVVKIPVPYGSKIGAEVSRVTFPIIHASAGRVYFRLSFRTVEGRGEYVTHIDDLTKAVVPVIAKKASRHFYERTGDPIRISNATLTMPVKSNIRNARSGKFDTVYKYVSVR